MIQAQDLEIGSTFWFDNREHRVVDIIKGQIVEVVTRKLSVLGDYRVDFCLALDTELMTEPTGTPDPLD